MDISPVICDPLLRRYWKEMGVNASRNNIKSKSHKVIKSRSSTNVIKVESFESFSSSDGENSSSFAEKFSKKTGITKHKGSNTCIKVSKPPEEVVIQRNTWTNTKKASKPLKVYVRGNEESKNGRKSPVAKTDISIHSIESDEDLQVSEVENPKPTATVKPFPIKGTNEYVRRDANDESVRVKSYDNKIPGLGTMKDAEILKRRKTDPFQGLFPSRNKPLMNTPQNKPQFCDGLKPVAAKKPGQSNILDQLGEQGIISQKTEAERALGDLRQVGMIKERPGGTQYTLTYDTPRRQMTSRLLPLRGETQHITPTQRQKRSPWEHTVLKPDRNESCYTPSDLCPPMRNSTGKTWNDEIMPLEIRTTESDILKIKMMDLDLL